MNMLLAAADNVPDGWDRYGDLAGMFLTVFGYTATLASLRVANNTFEARLNHARLQTAYLEQIGEKTDELRIVNRALDAAADDEKYPIYLRSNKIREDREALQQKALDLERGLLASAARSRFSADLMLLLMVLGVAGGTVLLLLHFIVVAPLVFGIAPGAYLAYRRLNGATKDASGMAHTERMRQLEYDEKRLELDEKRLQIAEQREAQELSAESQRIELLGKRHELHEKLHHQQTDDHE